MGKQNQKSPLKEWFVTLMFLLFILTLIFVKEYKKRSIAYSAAVYRDFSIFRLCENQDFCYSPSHESKRVIKKQ